MPPDQRWQWAELRAAVIAQCLNFATVSRMRCMQNLLHSGTACNKCQSLAFASVHARSRNCLSLSKLLPLSANCSGTKQRPVQNTYFREQLL